MIHRFTNSLFTQDKKMIKKTIERVREQVYTKGKTVKEKIRKKKISARLQTLQKSSSNVTITFRAKMQPPTYDEQIPWPVHQKQFEAAFEANGWN